MISKSRTFDIKIIVLGALFIVSGFIFFYQLGSIPLLDYDESIYAQVAREQLENPGIAFTWKGNISLYRDQLWFEKPPLMIWLIESAFLVFGINEFAARFWMAVFAFFIVILTFFAAKKAFKSASAGIFAASVYLITFQFLYFSRILQFDIPAAFFILLSLFIFQQSWENPKYLQLFWISVALGVMIKSVIGLLPLLVVGIFQLIRLDFKLMKLKEFWGGLAYSF